MPVEGKGKGGWKGAKGKHDVGGGRGGSYKADLCSFFEKGLCTKGDQCTFAHGRRELRSQQSMSKGGNSEKGSSKGGEQSMSRGGNSEKGSSKGGGFKSDLCLFFERGVCSKGDLCTYAHGKEELRRTNGDNFGSRPVADRESQAILAADQLWLKTMKEQPGQKGLDFCATWKSWCGNNGVSKMEKHEWAVAIANFRAAYDAGGVVVVTAAVADIEDGDRAIEQTMKAASVEDDKQAYATFSSGNQPNLPREKPGDHVSDQKWLKMMKDQAGKEGMDFNARWKSWCAKNGVRNMEKHEWSIAISNFRASYDAGEIANVVVPNVKLATTANKFANEQSKKLTSAEKDGKSCETFSPSPWLLRAAASVRQLLTAAKDIGSLHKALSLSRADAEWQRLVAAGQIELKRVAVDHASRVAGSFLDAFDLSSLAALCYSRTQLSCAFQLLDFCSFIQPKGTLESQAEADIVAAVVGELQLDSSETKSLGSKAKRGLVDFLCMLGTGFL